MTRSIQPKDDYQIQVSHASFGNSSDGQCFWNKPLPEAGKKELCLHRSLQGGRNEHGFYNKSISRIQPTKLYALTGTFSHLECDRHIILTRYFYLALTLLIDKVISTIAWHIPQNCSSSLFSNVWTYFQHHLHSFCKKRREPQQQSVSYCFLSIVLLVRKWHQCPSLKYQSLAWSLIWLVLNPKSLNWILYFCKNKVMLDCCIKRRCRWSAQRSWSHVFHLLYKS